MRHLCALALLFALLAGPAAAQDLPSIADKTEGTERLDGFLPLYWDADAGTLWMEVEAFEEDFLYVNYLTAGLGSNDVGLDRGQLGDTRVVRFERVGPKVLLVQPNQTYRAQSDNPAERQAVRDAFADGVLWGFEAAAETDGRVLVDATDFVVRDVHGAIQQLQQSGQGAYRLDQGRSTPDIARSGAFPDNTELEARLTFVATGTPGPEVRRTAAAPSSFSLRMRHSLVRLPEADTFAQRAHHPRSGYYSFRYEDYAAPLTEDMTQRFIPRHRLQCADAPGDDGLCTPEEPIVYYLDRGTPEPVRTALLDGARWWNEAFEAAGYRDAFQVHMLPEDADPMDIRYNVIQWVHRSTRGWSYGPSVTDPRTGEILKAHIVLGSLRVRQDLRLAEGLMAPYTGDAATGLPDDSPLLDMALDRIRQLSAHEIGHTLGLRHNFAASTHDRASVMDYPAPYATLNDAGEVSLQDAYASGMGAWDTIAIRYGYAYPDEDESEAELLARIMQEYDEQGLTYISDADARPAGAAHPQANLWDNGTDMVEALNHEMEVRRMALDNFGESVIPIGTPHARMEEVLVPLYLRHRYQVQATAKLIGGFRYRYSVRGDAGATPRRVSPETQRAALDALLRVVEPEALRLPDTARTQIPPRPPGYPANRELFPGRTGLPFDADAPAEIVATMVFDQLLHPERTARLTQQSPILHEVLDRVTDAVWEWNRSDVQRDASSQALKRVVQRVWTDALLEHAAHEDTAPEVRAHLTWHLREIRAWLGRQLEDVTTSHRSNTPPSPEAHHSHLLDQIERFLNRDYETETAAPALDTPPGSPIGQSVPAYQQRQQQRRVWMQNALPERAACHAPW